MINTFQGKEEIISYLLSIARISLALGYVPRALNKGKGNFYTKNRQ